MFDNCKLKKIRQDRVGWTTHNSVLKYIVFVKKFNIPCEKLVLLTTEHLIKQRKELKYGTFTLGNYNVAVAINV